MTEGVPVSEEGGTRGRDAELWQRIETKEEGKG
jgi:hypothetical protein